MKLAHLILTNKFINLIAKDNHIARFIRFSIIGVFNTLHYYFWHLVLLNLKINFVASHTISATHYVLKNPGQVPREKGSTAKTFFINVLKTGLIIAALGAFAAGCFLSVIKSGKLFGLSGSDSILQLLHFVPFLQKAFLSGHPLWSWSYGLGGDVYGEFSYYYTTSPFFYLLLLVRKLGFGHWAFADYLQWKLILSIIKDLLAMLGMYALLKYERHKNYLAVIGAVVYGGAVWFGYYSLYFDFMTDAYVWVPLAIWGLRIYQNSGRWLSYVVTAAVTVINSFYFGYISLIYYGIFALLFFWTKGQSLRAYAIRIGKFILLTLASIALAGFSFLPSVLTFFHIDRVSVQTKISLLYGLKYYRDLPLNVFTYSDKLGFPLLLLLIFSLKRRNLSGIAQRKTILSFIMTLFLLTPYAGSVFNGFSYSSSRWYYLVAFTMAYVLPEWIEESGKLRRRDLYLSLSATGFAAIYFSYKFGHSADLIINRNITQFIDLLWLTASVLPIGLIYLKHCFRGAAIRSLLNYFMVLCIAAAALINSNICLYLHAPNVTKSYLQSSGMENPEEQWLFKQLTPANHQFYRTVVRDISQENAPLNYGYYGTSAYNSMLSGNLHRWLTVDHDVLSPYVSPSRYRNFDDRLFLETVFAVRYIVVRQTDNFKIPYGYNLREQTTDYKVYENRQNVGFDLWYPTYIDVQSYNKMNIAEKDAMLLQTAAVESPIAGMAKNKPNQATNELSLDWSGATMHDVELKDGKLSAGRDASLSVPVDRQKNNSGRGEIIFSMHLIPVNGQAVKLSVNGKSTIKMDAAYPYTYPNDQYTFCLDDRITSLNIGISEGEYLIRDAHAWFNSYSHYPSWVNQRNKYNLEGLSIDGGNVTGTIRNQEKGILALNIPFNRGWTAKIDGKRQELLKVNGIFSGLVLNPGLHKVELTFITPGLLPGVMLSLVVFLSILGLILKKSLLN